MFKKNIVLVSLVLMLISGCASQKVTMPTDIQADEIVIIQGKDEVYLPNISEQRLECKEFVVKPVLEYSNARIDVYRQTKEVAKNVGGMVDQNRKVEWKEEPEKYEVICFSLGEGLYIDVGGNVFLKPAEAFGIEGIKTVRDERKVKSNLFYISENNKVWLSNKNGKKRNLIAEKTADGFLSHDNGIFGKKQMLLTFDAEEEEYLFKRGKGFSVDIPVRFKVIDNKFVLTQSFLKFATNFKIQRKKNHIEVLMKEKTVAIMNRYENKILIQETESKGKIITRQGNLITVSTYGYR